MKRTLSLLLALLLVLPLTSCVITYEEDTFFEYDTLEEHYLWDMPAPDLTNSKRSENTIYLNLTNEEFFSYAQSLTSYLLERTDLHYLSFIHQTGLEGEIAPYGICAPLEEDYLQRRENTNRFVFSMTDRLEQSNLGDTLQNPIQIMLLRENGTLRRDNFSYNAKLVLIGAGDTYRRMVYVPCADQHRYDSPVLYPIIGSDEQISVRTCLRCGNEDQSAFPTDNHSYRITVMDEQSMILDASHTISCMSGMKVTFTVVKPIMAPHTKEVFFVVNNEALEPLSTLPNGDLLYGFIMPKGDVEISVAAVPFDTIEAAVEDIRARYALWQGIPIDGVEVNYFGTYSDYYVAYITPGYGDSVVWHEVIEDYDFVYRDSNRILVCPCREVEIAIVKPLMTLTVAYESGRLTLEDIANIWLAYNGLEKPCIQRP